MPRPPYPRFPSRPTPEALSSLFAIQRESDPFGTRLHLALACLALFIAGFPTTFVEWAMLPLAVAAIVRLFTHHRVLGPLFWDPVVRLSIAFAAWMALSRLWTSGSHADWLADFQNFRFAAIIPLLYPVLDHRRTLIAALALGLVAGQLSQLTHFIGLQFDLPALTWNRFPDRISGWWDPVVAGSLLCAALGIALGFLLPLPEGGGRGVGGEGPRSNPTRSLRASRLLPFLLLPLTLFSLFITGTRGAWISAAVLLAALALLWVLRLIRGHHGVPRLDRPSGRQAVPSDDQSTLSRRVGRLALLLLPLLLAITAYFASPPLRARLDRGITEVRAALTTQNYDSDTGRRIAMWRWAAIEFQSHPIRGVGAGGYQPYARTLSASPPPPHSPLTTHHSSLPPPHAHAHSWPLHTLATLGLVGFAILSALLIAALRSSLMPGAQCLMPALLGLTLAGLFDTILINQQTANLLFILLALNVRYRPSIAP